MVISRALLGAGIVAGLLSIPFPAVAEDLNSILKNVTQQVEKKNFPKALEELAWAEKEIQKMHTNRLQTLLPNEVIGYRGSEIESNSALGFSALERTYSKGGNEIRLSLASTKGGADAGGLGGLGGLAALGRMAAMMGNQPGQETFRISGLTATQISHPGGGGELSVFLDSGAIVKLEANEAADFKNLRPFAEAINLGALDSYLRGQG